MVAGRTGAQRRALGARAGTLHAVRVHAPAHTQRGVALPGAVEAARVARRHVRACGQTEHLARGRLVGDKGRPLEDGGH